MKYYEKLWHAAIRVGQVNHVFLKNNIGGSLHEVKCASMCYDCDQHEVN
jgi:hypothetical protein